MTEPVKIEDIASQYGMIDGAHHKQWVIDQMLQAALGDAGYLAWRIKEARERVAGGHAPWDEGIAP